VHPQDAATKRVRGFAKRQTPKLLNLLTLWGWLAALDDFRNWLIDEAA
jgi:hypothetical protein